MDYEKFDGDDEVKIDRQNSAELAPSEVVSTSAKGSIDDFQIQVDEKPGTSTLKIYDTEKNSDLTYTEDPGSREVPRTVIE